jgi:hypothetical protein
MKGKRHHKSTGGTNTAADDVKTDPEARTNAKHVDSEAEEKKHGGRAKRKHGGKAHHEMKVHGEKGAHHAGRKPRKSGGRTGSDGHPFSSAKGGSQPSGRSVMSESMD